MVHPHTTIKLRYFQCTFEHRQYHAKPAAGMMEIVKLHEACMSHPELRQCTGNGKYIIGMHSALSTAEQQVAFDRPPNGGLGRGFREGGSGGVQVLDPLWRSLRHPHSPVAFTRVVVEQ